MSFKTNGLFAFAGGDGSFKRAHSPLRVHRQLIT